MAKPICIEWVSITEHEPDTSDHVLVTIKWPEGEPEVCELDYGVEKYCAERGNKVCKEIISNVIAWAYMPKPYTENEE